MREMLSYKVNERPIVFIAYSLGVLIVKRVSNRRWSDKEEADKPKVLLEAQKYGASSLLCRYVQGTVLGRPAFLMRESLRL